VSGAAKSLCMWVRAMETYGIIFRQVAPKKEKLRAAQETLEKKQVRYCFCLHFFLENPKRSSPKTSRNSRKTS
jgi:hypothetical protein